MNPALVGIIGSGPGVSVPISVGNDELLETGTNANSYTTGSLTFGPASGPGLSLVAVWHTVSSGTPNAPVMNDWDVVVSAEAGLGRLDLMRRWLAAPVTEDVEFTFAGQTQTAIIARFSVATGVVNGAGDNGASCIVQSAAAVDLSGTSHSIALDPFESAPPQNASFGAFTAGGAMTPGAGFTGLNTSEIETVWLRSIWRLADADPSVTWSGSSASYGVAAELKAG